MPKDGTSQGTADELRLLSGKRRAPRRRRSVQVRCIGPAGRWFAGRTVDVSRGGLLVEITDQEFLPLGEAPDLIPFAARVAMQFPHGMDVNFGDGAVQVHADIVRLVSRQGRSPLMLLGCQFEPPLSDFDCRLLGIDPGSDETTEPAAPLESHEGHFAAHAAAKAAAAPPPPVLQGTVADAAYGLGAGKSGADASQATPAGARAAKPSAPEADQKGGALPLLRGSDELRSLIGMEEERWKEEAPAAEAPPKARIISFSRVTQFTEEPSTGPAPAIAPARAPVHAPGLTPAPRIDEADVESLKRPAQSRTPGSHQPTTSAWAASDTVVVHLFPANGSLHGPRFLARMTDLKVRTAVVELPLPDGEDDPAAWAAVLGVAVRAVCIRDGRVLWETRARVVHVGAADTAGWARATLLALRAPPLYARRMLGLSPVSV